LDRVYSGGVDVDDDDDDDDDEEEEKGSVDGGCGW